MARIAGVNLPQDKRIEVALSYIHGIGVSLSRKILKESKIDFDVRVKDMSAADENKLREYIEKNLKVEGDLKAKVMMDIKRLKDIGCYRGERHKKNLPVRGQNTRRNSRTVRGNVRKTAGSGKRPAAEKT